MNSFAKITSAALLLIAAAEADINRSFSKTDAEIDKSFPLAVEERGAAAQHLTLAKLRQRIEECRTLTGSEAIPVLGKMVRQLARENIYQVPERIEIYDLARDLLISIPGHAEYFGKEIQQLTEDEFAGRPIPHSSDRGWYFQTLQELSSPETVKVLGELLFDERDLDGDAPTDSPWTANSLKAVYTFQYLGLRDPPVEYHGASEDLPAWQLWYEKVRDGKLTLSFKGDDTVYTLNGPVAKAAGPDRTKDKLPVIVDETEPKKPSFLPLFIALCLLAVCIIGGIAVWTKRRSA